MPDIIRRTDLEAMPVKLPEYVGASIFPWLEKDQVAGTMYYYDLQSDFAAQTGRDTAAVASITLGKTMAAASTTFSCVEKRARVRMGYDQVRGYKDPAKADIAMGRSAKRSWFNAHEQAVADALLKTSGTDISSDVVAGIDSYVAEMLDLARGPVALCLSWQNFVKLKANTVVKERLKNTGIAVNSGGDPRYITKEQLAIVFGVDRVLVGPDTQWYTGVTSDYNRNAALVVLPDENADPEEEPQLGRSVYFAWDSDAKYFIMESFHDNLTDSNYVDAKGHYVIKTLNEELAKTLTLFAAPAESPT